jgi:hypothetical protein
MLRHEGMLLGVTEETWALSCIASHCDLLEWALLLQHHDKRVVFVEVLKLEL